MAQGLNLAASKEHVCSMDKDTPPTKWHIGAVDSVIMTMAGLGSKSTSDVMMTLVKFGLKGVADFKDAQGKEIQFEKGQEIVSGVTYQVVARSLLRVIPLAYIVELGTEILNLSTLSGEQIKN